MHVSGAAAIIKSYLILVLIDIIIAPSFSILASTSLMCHMWFSVVTTVNKHYFMVTKFCKILIFAHLQVKYICTYWTDFILATFNFCESLKIHKFSNFCTSRNNVY